MELTALAYDRPREGQYAKVRHCLRCTLFLEGPRFRGFGMQLSAIVTTSSRLQTESLKPAA